MRRFIFMICITRNLACRAEQVFPGKTCGYSLIVGLITCGAMRPMAGCITTDCKPTGYWCKIKINGGAANDDEESVKSCKKLTDVRKRF